MRILLIEDEPVLANAIHSHVESEGHAVDWAARLDVAELSLRTTDYGLVLLDLHLPDGRGLDLLKALRDKGNRCPVIILTARDQISDRIEGLNAGADDYLVKPFDLNELSARIHAVSRRYVGDPSPRLVLGSIEIDRATRQVWRDGSESALTRREWAIVDLLAARPGAVYSKRKIEDALYDFDADIESNTVEAHVSRLRKKLGRAAIGTVRGVGYRLVTPP